MSREQVTYASAVDELPRRPQPAHAPRVLIVSGYSGGGIWHYACSLSRALAASGMDVALAAPVPFEPVQGMEAVPIWPLGVARTRTPTWFVDLPRRMISQVGKLRGLSRLVMKYRPGIVHLHDQMGELDFLYLRVLKRLGVRIVFTAHDPRPLTGTYGWLDRARYREADAIFVHSTNGVQELVADGVDAGKITRIEHPNYLHFCDEPLPRTRARQLLGIPGAARSILFFGMISPYKGLDILLQAFSNLSQSDAQAHLTIAGQPLEEFAPYRRQIERLGLGARVLTDLRQIPFAEFSKFFCSADVLALPYRRVHQSGILQLAYGFGRPVVVTDVGGLGEAVREDRTGVIVRREDPRSLASGLLQLLADPPAAEEMGRRGRRLAETKYSWGAAAEQITRVYRSLHPRAAPETR